MNKALLSLAAIAVATCANAVTPTALPSGVTAISPAQGVVDTSVNEYPLGVGEIAVTFSQAPAVNEQSEATASLYFGDDTAPLYTATIKDVNVDNMGAPVGRVTFNAKVVDPGTYRVVIPEGYWLLGTDATPSPALELNYEILEVFKITPRQGIVDDLSTITITFPNADEVTVNSSVHSEVIPPIGSDDEFSLDYSVEKTDNGVVVTATIINMNGDPVTLTEPGIYTYHAVGGAFTAITYGPNHDTDSSDITSIKTQEIRIPYTISALPAPAITPAPGTVKEFNTFTLKYPEDLDVMMVNNMAQSQIFKMRADGSFDANPICKLTATDNREERELTLSIIGEDNIAPENGTYVLQVAQALLFGWLPDGGTFSSPAYEYIYEVDQSTIVSIRPVDPDSVNVFRLDGTTVLLDADKEAVDTLPAGCYVVNGSVIIVK